MWLAALVDHTLNHESDNLVISSQNTVAFQHHLDKCIILWNGILCPMDAFCMVAREAVSCVTGSTKPKASQIDIDIAVDVLGLTLPYFMVFIGWLNLTRYYPKKAALFTVGYKGILICPRPPQNMKAEIEKRRSTVLLNKTTHNRQPFFLQHTASVSLTEFMFWPALDNGSLVQLPAVWPKLVPVHPEPE